MERRINFKRIARLDLVRRVAMQLAVVPVAEHPAEILVEQSTPSPMLSNTVCMIWCVRSTSSRAASAASLEVASACSRSFSSVMSRITAMTSPFRSGMKRN